MPHERHDPLLKNEPAPRAYGATSSSSGLEAGTGDAQPQETTGWFSPTTKRIVAGSALLLSGGMKVAELIVTKSYRNHAPFEPVREMVIIGWILTYMLQLDYVYMIGHTPTDEDPAGYAAACALASSKIYKFVSVHLLLALWQLFHIFELHILSLVSIGLAFLLLINMYLELSADRTPEENTSLAMITRSERQNIPSPSFIQGPISSLLIMAGFIWIPGAAIDLELLRHPDEELRLIRWRYATWLFSVMIIGSQISTRIGYIANKRNVTNTNDATAGTAGTTGTTGTAGTAGGVPPVSNAAVGTDKRLVPVDLAAVLGLFWVSIAIAAGPGPVNDGPVVVVSYLCAGWQALGIIVAIT